jgi:putative endonuclease
MESSAVTRNDEAGIGTRQDRCFVYILGSYGKIGFRTYVGWTINLDRRLSEHNAGTGARSTRGRSWTLLYVERYSTRRDAMSREWHLKRDRRFRKSLSQIEMSAI